MDNNRSYEDLTRELEETKRLLVETQYQLEDANDTMEAIRSGGVDALVVNSQGGHLLYSLENADLSYRIFIEQMNEGAVTLNAAGNILYSNSRFAEWISLTLDKLIGKPIIHFIHPHDRPLWDQLVDAAWNEDTKGQVNLTSDSGETIPVSVSFKMLLFDGQQSLGIIISDLSQQKLAQKLLVEQNTQLEKAQAVVVALNLDLENKVSARTKELYNNQQYLTSVLETMAEGVVLINIDRKITYANPMAQIILGFNQADILRRKYGDSKWMNYRVDGTLLSTEEHPMHVVMKTGKPIFDYEIGVKTGSKELFYISINAAPIKNENGEITGGIGTFMDVTNRRKAVQQKDEFISVASHELRTPITSLKASLQLLEKLKSSPLSPMLPILIDQSNKSLNKVSTLINDLLNATKVTEGQLVFNKSEFLIADLIKETCHHLRVQDIYHIRCEGDADIKVNADKEKIDQVLVNFVNNAVKYAPDSKDILITYEQNGDTVKVAVTDKGPGIPAQKLPHLFDRYYRVDTGGHQYSGLGLGLYICAEIIKKHNGKIGAESMEGSGSTFWFALPVSGE